MRLPAESSEANIPEIAPPAPSPRLRLPMLPAALALSLAVNVLLLALWQSERVGRAFGADSTPSGAAPAGRAGGSADSAADLNPQRLAGQVNPVSGYELPARFGDLGPQLIQAGAIDPGRFIQVYQEAGRPLAPDQLAVLLDGGDVPVFIDHDSSYFLLNFFWALGLANRSPVLEDGLMTTYSQGDIGRFASTGGWTLGARPATELYASATILELTPAQHALVERVASQIYRPCCDNHAAFPDCNHGMAMLGMLQWLASQGATKPQMLEAAKYTNSFWFPQQAMEVATYLYVTQGIDFDQAAAGEVVGRELFSGSGFNELHRWLADHGLLQQVPGPAGSCGV